MSERISNTQQQVDLEKYGSEFDRIFGPSKDCIERTKERQRKERPDLWPEQGDDEDVDREAN